MPTKRDVHWPLAVHLAAVLPAAVLGPVILLRKKGTPVHRLMGRTWVTLMTVGAVSSFGITEVMPALGGRSEGTSVERRWSPWNFSPIHLLSAYTLYAMGKGIRAIRSGNVNVHRRCMVGSMMGLVGAGAATLIPGRRVHSWLTTGGQQPIDVITKR